MTERRSDWPDFIREAVDEEGDIAAEGGLRIAELLPAAPSRDPFGLDRLMATVSELPQRYAPFYDRLSMLWDLPESAVVAVLERSRDPQAWRKAALPGLKVIDVAGGHKTTGADTKLVRFSAGMTFPRHRHPGHEAILVLEGSYTDSTGRLVGPGDLHEMKPGTEHSFKIARDEPCIAASLQAGLEFTGPLMRVLVKLFG